MQPARCMTALLTRLLAAVAVGVVLLAGSAAASIRVSICAPGTGVQASAGARSAVSVSTGSETGSTRTATVAHPTSRPALSAMLRHERTSVRPTQRQCGTQHSQLQVAFAVRRASTPGMDHGAVLGAPLGGPSDRPGGTAGSRAPPTWWGAAPAPLI